MIEVFKRVDFISVGDGFESYKFTEIEADRIAIKANELINERAQVVYGSIHYDWAWTKVKDSKDTHKALLIGVTKLEEKKVEVTREKLLAAINKNTRKDFVCSGLDPKGFFEDLGL